MSPPLTVCYFGIFNPDYVRNRIIRKGLTANGAQVVMCMTRTSGIRKYWQLLTRHQRLEPYDAMLVGFPGSTIMPLAQILARWRGKRVVFDSYNSQYHALVDIRRQATRGNFQAKLTYWRERLACRLADVVLMDTDAHCRFMAQTYQLPAEKFRRLLVGSDLPDYFGQRPPPAKPAGKILCHFHGGYSPFQGVDVILRAAKRLENSSVHFNLIGAGQEYETMRSLARQLQVQNVSFILPVDYPTLAAYLQIADISLGVFGATETGLRPVIPNKVFEGMAAAKPVVTAHLPAMDELLADGENVVFCTPGDDAGLAEKIRQLAVDSRRRERIGASARRLYEQRLTPAILGRELITIFSLR